MSLDPYIRPEENGGSEKVKGFEEGTRLASSRAESHVFFDTTKYAFLSASFISLSMEPCSNMLINSGSDLLLHLSVQRTLHTSM